MKPEDFELTTVSSKGQIVMPKDIRNEMKIKEGSVLAVTAYPKKNMIVMKTIKKTGEEQELELLQEAEKGWKEIESGKFRKMSKDKFLEKLEKW